MEKINSNDTHFSDLANTVGKVLIAAEPQFDKSRVTSEGQNNHILYLHNGLIETTFVVDIHFRTMPEDFDIAEWTCSLELEDGDKPIVGKGRALCPKMLEEQFLAPLNIVASLLPCLEQYSLYKDC